MEKILLRICKFSARAHLVWTHRFPPISRGSVIALMFLYYVSLQTLSSSWSYWLILLFSMNIQCVKGNFYQWSMGENALEVTLNEYALPNDSQNSPACAQTVCRSQGFFIQRWALVGLFLCAVHRYSLSCIFVIFLINLNESRANIRVGLATIVTTC